MTLMMAALQSVGQKIEDKEMQKQLIIAATVIYSLLSEQIGGRLL